MDWFAILFWLGLILLADAAIGAFWFDRLQKSVSFKLRPLILAEAGLALVLVAIWLLFA